MSCAIKSIMAPIAPARDAEALLTWAGAVGGWFDANIDAVFLRDDWRAASYYGGFSPMGYSVPAAVLDQLEEEVAAQQADVQRVFDRASAAAPQGRFARFFSIPREFDGGLGTASRCFDLGVALRPDGDEALARESIIHALTLPGGCPVFVAPSGAQPPASIKRVMLAWDGSLEASRALRAALPFMKPGVEATVVHVESSGSHDMPTIDALSLLRRHEVQAIGHPLKPAFVRDAPRLLMEVEHMKPDLLVMGAFGQPRWMEGLFDGATHHMLHHASVPLLLAH